MDDPARQAIRKTCEASQSLWRRISWYPWRSRDEWIASQEGAWAPWAKPRLDANGRKGSDNG